MSYRNITTEINDLVNNHGDENILELRFSIEIADIVFDAYSDVFKEKNGFRPRNPITVKECVENLKDYIEG